MLFKKALLGAIALSAMLTGTMARAEDLKEFRIGILGGENETDRLRNFGCLADHLKETFGFEKVSLFPAADYDGVIQGLLGGTLDFAELGASGYAAVYIKDPKAVTPILTTQQTDGSTGYYSIGLARKDSGIKTIADAKGKTLGYADPDSTSGYLVPLTQIPKTTGMPNDKFFAKTQFNGGHENNLLAAYDGKVDVAVDDFPASAISRMATLPARSARKSTRAPLILACWSKYGVRLLSRTARWSFAMVLVTNGTPSLPISS